MVHGLPHKDEWNLLLFNIVIWFRWANGRSDAHTENLVQG